MDQPSIEAMKRELSRNLSNVMLMKETEALAQNVIFGDIESRERLIILKWRIEDQIMQGDDTFLEALRFVRQLLKDTEHISN